MRNRLAIKIDELKKQTFTSWELLENKLINVKKYNELKDRETNRNRKTIYRIYQLVGYLNLTLWISEWHKEDDIEIPYWGDWIQLKHDTFDVLKWHIV